MGHVFTRLSGYGMVLVPHWPYMFQRHPDGSGSVQVSHWTTDGRRDVVIQPGRSTEATDVVDISDGPNHPFWLIETSALRLRWPAGFTIESPQEPADHTPFYLHGPGDATIFPQGPEPTERLADPDALVAAGQTEQATVHNISVSELRTYYVMAGDTPVLVHNCGKINIDQDKYGAHPMDHVGKSEKDLKDRANDRNGPTSSLDEATAQATVDAVLDGVDLDKWANNDKTPVGAKREFTKTFPNPVGKTAYPNREGLVDAYTVTVVVKKAPKIAKHKGRWVVYTLTVK